MNQKIRYNIARALAVAGAFGLLAGCQTMHNMMGEMRGDKEMRGETVTLRGNNEVPANTSAATGTANVSVSEDCSVSGKITVSGMTATAAHIHTGAAGANGPVAVPFNKSGENAFETAGGAKMNAEQCAAYKAGNTYVNVHSAAHPGGEIRAQLRGR